VGSQAPDGMTEIKCGVREAQKGKTCEPFDDPRSHDFQGCKTIEYPEGGCLQTSVCTRCGISSFSHSMRYGP
jgi:hypothetical protein